MTRPRKSELARLVARLIQERREAAMECGIEESSEMLGKAMMAVIDAVFPVYWERQLEQALGMAPGEAQQDDDPARDDD